MAHKNSMMFKSPLSDRHMMRDMSNHGPSVTSKLYDESEHEESTSIYHEPYRLVLQRGKGHFFSKANCHFGFNSQFHYKFIATIVQLLFMMNEHHSFANFSKQDESSHYVFTS